LVGVSESASTPDADIQLARQTGYRLERFQSLLGTSDPSNSASKSQQIQELHLQWTEIVANRRADIEAGVIEPKKEKPVNKDQLDPKWAKAKEICRLNLEDIRKAKELGLTPQALIRNVPGPRQQWKAPVKVWIEDLYEKRIASRREYMKSSGQVMTDGPRKAKAALPPPSNGETIVTHDSIVGAWEENAKRTDEENYLFLRSLKFEDYGFDVDKVTKELHETTFQVVDCMRCANCCKTKTPKFEESDVERISAHLNMASAEFIDRYREADPEEPPYRTRQTPCPLLGEDNRCSVYEVRPTVCREYPYTDKEGLSHRTMSVANNTLVCPAVYHIVDQLKRRAGQ
jgi:uncharacterized protein